jgi:hypothetical protein
LLVVLKRRHDLSYANPKFLVKIFVTDLLFCKPERGDHYNVRLSPILQQEDETIVRVVFITKNKAQFSES